ncbi:MAG TPA: SAVED domain-containing protein [Solirubrobacterales bacterium]|nr:SAVED domain-containing protein [Solirubrobacterales bacterium]
MRDPRRELASASAARLSGDDYQHLFTLMQAVRLLRQDVFGITRVRMEADQAGNVDDLIVEYDGKPTVYHQVKFSRLAGEPLAHDWFTDFGSSKHSPLQRFYKSFIDLTLEGRRPYMALVTNRTIASDDPILRHIEGRDALLTPRLAEPGPNSASGKARAAWAEHLDIDEEQLLEMLDHLQIKAGVGTLEELRDRCAETMLAVGLRGDDEAVAVGHSAIRDLIENGCEGIEPDAMRELVDRHQLGGSRPVAHLRVAAIDRPPSFGSATADLDWVDLYEGADPRARRRLRDPKAVQGMGVELADTRRRIETLGYSDVSIGGAFRLDVGFALGAEFADTCGFQLSVMQRGESWGTEEAAEPFGLQVSDRGVGRGDGIAVCVSISNEIAADVVHFIEAEDSPVKRLLTLSPDDGPDRAAISSPAQARGCAAAILGQLRERSKNFPEIHLFLSCPNGLAVLLGHVWNRLPPTRVYADTSPGYQPTFRVTG